MEFRLEILASFALIYNLGGITEIGRRRPVSTRLVRAGGRTSVDQRPDSSRSEGVGRGKESRRHRESVDNNRTLSDGDDTDQRATPTVSSVPCSR
ncbi:hypothetical protein EA472_09630 [Natrarchaeobius oligotrophus]|uniref:Uncharacterized protein n=1 Tax=Natrarchaeobius chitinivorans TaxID=1679083 RepID=A0A3N6N0A7_NATCH|nr:hypothetical protein EA472_09630 [Natrarchaeobius chitinivorans]